jgi:hypothetical protein
MRERQREGGRERNRGSETEETELKNNQKCKEKYIVLPFLICFRI